MHAIIAEGIRSVDGWEKNTSSAAHMVKIGTAQSLCSQIAILEQCAYDFLVYFVLFK